MGIFHARQRSSIFSNNLEKRRSVLVFNLSFYTYIYIVLVSYTSWSTDRDFEKKTRKEI